MSAAVQGVGDVQGYGALLDTSGDDRYEVTANSAARASAVQAGNGPSPQAAATAGDSTVVARSLPLNSGIDPRPGKR